MKVYNSNDLRNVAILGHSGCGKSNLIDALAYTTNISKKMPNLEAEIEKGDVVPPFLIDLLT